MKRGEAFPSRWLAQGDLSSPVIATIDAVRNETIPGDNEDADKPVLYFKNDQLKKMILNSANWTTLESAFGDESDNWSGKQIEVYVDPSIMFGKKRVGGVRIRVPSQSARPSPAPAGNGLFTWPQARSAIEAAGLQSADFVAHMKQLGHTGWNPVRDTPTAKDFIAQNQGGSDLEAELATEGQEIPF